MNKAVFLDKDGTLIENIPYNTDPARIRFCRGAFEALGRLQAAGYKLVVVSNQPGVALGLFEEKALKSVAETLRRRMHAHRLSLDGFYYCPHFPEGKVSAYAFKCTCRKPMPGMLVHAGVQLDLDLRSSWMIGDILDDVQAGKRARCRTILIDKGNETEWKLDCPSRHPDFMVKNMAEAAEVILGYQAQVRPDYKQYYYERTVQSSA